MKSAKKLQVFVSSTYKDLIQERQAAVEAILEAGHIPAGMELFTAGDESQLQTIYRWIDECDVYLLILGGRYGSIESVSNRSYTELEFDYAAKGRKPSFSVVISEHALEQKVKKEGLAVVEREASERMSAFRKKVLSRTTTFFSDIKDIKLGIIKSLNEKVRDPELVGWVRAGQAFQDSFQPKICATSGDVDTSETRYHDKKRLPDLPSIPEVSDPTRVTITTGRYGGSVTLLGTWANFFPCFVESLVYNVHDWQDEYYFNVDVSKSCSHLANSLLYLVQGYAVPKAEVSHVDFERLRAFYVESGLMRDGEGEEPFESYGKKLARRARINRSENLSDFEVVAGSLPISDPDEIPF